MRIAMIGAGYVGLVTGACFADFGHEVVCVDVDAEKIARLNEGRVPIFEPGLAELVALNRRAGRLFFTSDTSRALVSVEAAFIAVGTPARVEDGAADLSYVEAATRAIAEYADGFLVVVLKSTAPIGTCDAVEARLAEGGAKGGFSVVSNPEFLREGAAIGDFKRPDRVVVGVEDERAKRVMADIYRPLAQSGAPIVYTTRRSAELIKYAANVFLAMKVTFINEIADLCESVGGDVVDVANGVGLDSRIGRKFLSAGPGFGGSCFPKDTVALTRFAKEARAPLRLVETLVEVNVERKLAMARKIVRACGGSMSGKRVAVLGLTYKPNTDDMRDAPSLTIVPALKAAGAKIVAFDPEGMASARAQLPEIEFSASAYECVEGADALAIVTEWDAFRALDMARVKASMRTPVVVDLRNVYDPEAMRGLGFIYEGVGRGAAASRSSPPSRGRRRTSEELSLDRLRP